MGFRINLIKLLDTLITLIGAGTTIITIIFRKDDNLDVFELISSSLLIVLFFSLVYFRLRKTSFMKYLKRFNSQSLAAYNGDISPNSTRLDDFWKNHNEIDVWRVMNEYIPSDVEEIVEDGVRKFKVGEIESVFDRLLDDKLNVAERYKLHLWIIGEAGIGKTTALYRLYFKYLDFIRGTNDDHHLLRKYFPEPLLIQPRLLSTKTIHSLRTASGSEKKNIAREILRIWIENRKFLHDKESSRFLVEDALIQLQKGRIILFIDGYDEIDRLKISHDLFNELRGLSRHYICCSRPEYIRELTSAASGDTWLHLSPWTMDKVEKFLRSRFQKAGVEEKVIRMTLENIAGERDQWSRYPRFLNLLSDVITTSPGSFRIDKFSRSIDLIGSLEEQEIKRVSSIDPDITEELYRSTLVELAKNQLNDGPQVMSEAELKEKKLNIIIEFDTFFKKSKLTKASSRYEIQFSNYTILDYYLAVYYDERLLDGSWKKDDKLVHWSDTTISFMLDLALRDSFDAILFKIRKQLALEKENPFGSFIPFNFLRLLVQAYRYDLIEEISDYQFKGDNLDYVNLDNVKFENCRFDHSSLSHGSFKSTSFRNCSFVGTRLNNALAINCIFDNCSFGLNDESEELLKGMIFQNTEIIDDTLTTTSFEKFGIVNQYSRYEGSFGELFRKKRDVILGGTTLKSEQYYFSEIEKSIESIDEYPVILVDIMAYGSDKRIEKILNKDLEEKVRILVIDKYTEKLHELKERFTSDRVKIQDKNIKYKKSLKKTNLDLGGLLKRNFGRDNASIIIAKKALHELPADAQKSLILEVGQHLGHGGKCIFLCDTTNRMTEKGFRRLQEIRKGLEEISGKPVLVNEYLKEHCDFSQEVDADAQAIFINLWILLKDWANDNLNEFETRYFSSDFELNEWFHKAGLTKVDSRDFRYELAYSLFNELQIRKISSMLDSDKLKNQTKSYIDNLFVDRENDKFYLFSQFVVRNLWDRDTPTPLGEVLNAAELEIDYSRLFGQENFDHPLPRKNSIKFDMPVHVYHLQKN